MYMYVSKICAEGIFVTFPWWLKNMKSRSKIALFSNECHFEIWFPKKKTITFFWSKFSKLHKKDPILHVAATFSLKQGETRTSNGPIPHPLTTSLAVKSNKFKMHTKNNISLINSSIQRLTAFNMAASNSNKRTLLSGRSSGLKKPLA